MPSVENMMTVFLTGNGATISGDLRRRLLHVELFLREAKAEYRRIKNPLDEFTLRTLRPAVLSALWGITLGWDVNTGAARNFAKTLRDARLRTLERKRLRHSRTRWLRFPVPARPLHCFR